MLGRAVLIGRSATRRVAARQMSSQQQYQTYEFDSVTTGADDRWPVSRANFVINMCQEGEKIVVERMGKYHGVYEPGWFLALPFIDKLAYVIDTRERSLDVSETLSTSEEDLTVVASCGVSFALADAHTAAYGSSNPVAAMRHQVQAALRSIIAEQTLEEAASKKTKRTLGSRVKEIVRDSANEVGVDVRTIDVYDISPENEEVSKAMDELEDNNRRREETREQKQVAERKAEIVALEARANADAIRQVAQAEADATRIRAAAAADAIKLVSAVLNSNADRDAAQFVLGQLQLHAGHTSLLEKPTTNKQSTTAISDDDNVMSSSS